jgi:spermidine synthase
MKRPQLLLLLYVVFSLSGAAALMHEVVWFRMLSLVLGSSHLAATTTVSVFMLGLALGGYLLGATLGRYRNLLLLYGTLEVGIALFAGVFLLLMRLYPPLYVLLVHATGSAPLPLAFIRVLFAGIAMIIPTTLIGGTLPVVAALVARESRALGGHLSFLYGVNTIGAVGGAVAAGFFLLRHFPVATTVIVAAGINLSIGILGIAFSRLAPILQGEPAAADPLPERTSGESRGLPQADVVRTAVLWGIGISGFCALGYEVLWTRVLIIILGASDYGFTAMLVAFLLGIGLGGASYGLMRKPSRHREAGGAQPTATAAGKGFGAVQILIGLSTLLAMQHIFSLPAYAVFLQGLFSSLGASAFLSNQLANVTLAFSFLLVPAFLMGLAFPMAGEVNAFRGGTAGRAVGEIVSINTLGAVIGSALSGFALIYLVGIERSLQLLCLANVGLGVTVLGLSWGARRIAWGAPLVFGLCGALLVANPDRLKSWDTKYFSLYRTVSPEQFTDARAVRANMERHQTLYYAEGAEAIVSSVRDQQTGIVFFSTNGRTEASNGLSDAQTQYLLGHLPALLHKDPRTALVIGAGSGMTLGAVAAHPGIRTVVLVEIEPKVLGVTATFASYNHDVLNSKKLTIAFNDGRNYLLTSGERFDVITADPIHPWFRGAGYLYTTEYFRLAAEHLAPGGMICQWLPLYELSVADLQCIVKTFGQSFKYTMVWLTGQDAQLVGSNSPILIDECALEKRIAEPAIASDLGPVLIRSAEDLLSFFVAGDRGLRAFGAGGVVNTDDNLHLELSAPMSARIANASARNVEALTSFRESILPILVPAETEAARSSQRERWESKDRRLRIVDRAHVRYFLGGLGQAELRRTAASVEQEGPPLAPWETLKLFASAR